MYQVVPILAVSVASLLPAAIIHASHAAERLSLPGENIRPAVIRYAYDNPYGPNPHGPNPHGADPRGDDPADERHDPNLPANQEQDRYKAPKDIKDQPYPPP